MAHDTPAIGGVQEDSILWNHPCSKFGSSASMLQSNWLVFEIATQFNTNFYFKQYIRLYC